MKQIAMTSGTRFVLSFALLMSMALLLAVPAYAQSQAATPAAGAQSSSSAGYGPDRGASTEVTLDMPSKWQLAFPDLSQQLGRLPNPSFLPLDPYRELTGAERAYEANGIFGADLGGLLPFFAKRGISLNAGLAAAPAGLADAYNSHSIQGWNATLGAALGSFSIQGGYQVIDPRQFTPGGNTLASDPSMKGATVSAGLAFSHRLSLSANGEFYQGAQLPSTLNSSISPISNSLTDPTGQLDRYGVGLKYGLNGAYNVDLGYEYDQWNVDNDTATSLGIKAGRPTEQYITIGVGRSFNKYTSLRLLYQILQYNDDGTGLSLSSAGSGLTANSGVAISQFTMKF